MVNEKCYLKEEIRQKRDSQKRDRTPNGVYAFILQYDIAKT